MIYSNDCLLGYERQKNAQWRFYGKDTGSDDEAVITRMLQLELTHEGYVVITAFDGNEGLNKALNENPDLIILDVMLPKISGTELLRRLRMKSQIPVIMLTAKMIFQIKCPGWMPGLMIT